jgi:ADP-ribose pyrophosphatase YjhB (NUDIX family)
MVVGCIPLWDNRILLCKRNIEPRKGFWTLPAGYLECEETTEEGAMRETCEETGASVVGLQPYRLFDIVHIGQIYLMFLARLQSPEFHATEESIDVRLFEQNDIPWSNIAFSVIKKTLQHYCHDRRKNDFSFRLDKIAGPL